MPRKKAKALPPKMITVYAEILQETEKAILVRCHDDADGVWLPKSQIKYSGERGDTGVEIEIPELLADEKGFFEGMGRPESAMAAQVEASPSPAEPARPKTVTFYGSFNEEDQDDNGVVFTVEYDDASIDFTIPRDQIVALEYNMPETESASITVSRAYAIEAGMMEAPEEGQDGSDVSVSESAPEVPAGKRSFGDNVKWLKEESITVTQPLSEAEKARYAEEMAALDKEIEELEDERAAISSRLKKQIDAKEQERREMSAHVNNGEERTFTCDCLKDYGTGELVWAEAYPPYNEVRRRKMTPEEMRPSLLEYSEKRAASAPAEAEGDTEPSEDDGTSFDEPEALDVDAVAGALSDAPSDAEGTKNEAPADAAAAPESDTPGCASCAHQDVDPNQNPEDDPCSGCLTAGGPHHYAPITATTEQGQGVGAVQ